MTPARIGAIGICLLLGACVTPGAPGSPAPANSPLAGLLQKAATLTKDDVARAIVIATGPDPSKPVDPNGLKCFNWIYQQLPVLQAHLQELSPPPATAEPQGLLLSGIEKAHVAYINFSGDVNTLKGQFNTNCAAWILDNQQAVLTVLEKLRP
jgi:hypothetical protein